MREPTPCNITANLHKKTGSIVVMHQYLVKKVPEVRKNKLFDKFMRFADKVSLTIIFI